MSFDLTNQNISATFQNLLQQTGSDNALYDLEGNLVDNLKVSGSLQSTEFLQLESTSSVTGNKLHNRSGTLYWGNTNLQTGGSGLSNIIEDTTPQLGGNLDLNSNQISGSGKIDIETTDTNDFFLLKSGSLTSMKVNGQGVLQLGAFSFTPTAVKGGLYYDDGDDEFYAGKNN